MKTVVTAFKEHKEFKRIKYWDANDLSFNRDTYTPPHYADTIEILINKGAVGELYICGNRYTLGREHIFYIPSSGIYLTKYKKNDCVTIVSKITTEVLKLLLYLEAILTQGATQRLNYIINCFSLSFCQLVGGDGFTERGFTSATRYFSYRYKRKLRHLVRLNVCDVRTAVDPQSYSRSAQGNIRLNL